MPAPSAKPAPRPSFPRGARPTKKSPHYLTIVGDFFVKLAVLQQEVADLRKRTAACEKNGEVDKEARHRTQKDFALGT